MLSLSFHHLPPLTFQSFISESNQIFTSANELPCLSDLPCKRKLNHWQRKRLLNLMISHKLLATVNFKPPPPSHFKYLFLKVITFFMWLSSWFGHYYSKTQQMTHKHQNAKFFGGQGNHRFLSNFLNTPCNSEFQTPPLTFQIFISESNHIFTLASEQSCFLSLLIQGNLTTKKDKGCTI